MLLNTLYLFALFLLSPWLLWRRVRTGRYRAGVAAKLLSRVTVENPQRKPVAWFHGVSVGEIHLLSTVVAAFRKRHPDWLIVVSSTTDTGLAEARNRFADLPVIVWPFDFTWAVRRAMAAVNPTLLVLAEGELWPNAVRAAKEHGAKVVVINARMSPRTFSRSRRLARLLKSFVYQYVDRFAVQSDEYAERFRQLGVETGKILVTGSVKYDGAIGKSYRDHPLIQTVRSRDAESSERSAKMIWVAGSTHAPEEQIVLDAFSQLRSRYPNLHLFLVPRHPDRFEEVAKLITASSMPFVHRSAISEQMGELPPVILLDTVGELGAAWSLATVGYVGGTLDGKRGGQSMIEPAGYGVATVFGPHVWNFKDAANRLVETGGAVMVNSAVEVETAIAAILHDPAKRAKMGEAARQFVGLQQGATARTLDVLDELLGLGRPATRAA